jgi:hypothetical protein
VSKNNYKEKIDQRFVRNWTKKRSNRWLFALKESVLYSLFFAIVFYFVGDEFFNVMTFVVTFLAILIINFLFSYFLSFSTNEARFKKLQQLDSQDQ